MSCAARTGATVGNEPFGATLTFTYDAAGNRTQVQDSQGGIETSTFDADNRLSTRQFSGIGATQLRIDLTYQANGLLSTETRYSDLAGSTKVGTTTYLYDAVGRVTAINHYNGTGTAMATFPYNHDGGSRLPGEGNNGTPMTNSYDSTNQLTADGINTYTYDANGNRNNGSWTVGTGNQVTGDGTWTYS